MLATKLFFTKTVMYETVESIHKIVIELPQIYADLVREVPKEYSIAESSLGIDFIYTSGLRLKLDSGIPETVEELQAHLPDGCLPDGVCLEIECQPKLAMTEEWKLSQLLKALQKEIAASKHPGLVLGTIILSTQDVEFLKKYQIVGGLSDRLDSDCAFGKLEGSLWGAKLVSHKTMLPGRCMLLPRGVEATQVSCSFELDL